MSTYKLAPLLSQLVLRHSRIQHVTTKARDLTAEIPRQTNNIEWVSV